MVRNKKAGHEICTQHRMQICNDKLKQNVGLNLSVFHDKIDQYIIYGNKTLQSVADNNETM